MGTWTRQQKTNHGGAKCHHTVRREIGPWAQVTWSHRDHSTCSRAGPTPCQLHPYLP